MLKLSRLKQLQELSESHPQYFRHNYLKELTNAGYEEVSATEPKPAVQAKPGAGKKVLSGSSLVKAKPKPRESEGPSNGGLPIRTGNLD